MTSQSLVVKEYVVWHINNFYSVKILNSTSFEIDKKPYSFLFQRTTFKNASEDMLTILLKKDNISIDNSYSEKATMFTFGTVGPKQTTSTPRRSTPANNLTVTIFVEGEQGDLYFNQQRTVNLETVNENIWEVKRQKFNEESRCLVKGETETVTFICVFGPIGESINCINTAKEINISEVKKLSDRGSFESISADFTNLLDNETFSDVVLKCNDTSFKAHRNILSARSPVFAAMFQHDMLENRSGFVVLQDINAEIFSDFLRYIYSGKLTSLSEDTASVLYKAGDKYGIRMLKKDCAKYMASVLSINNICEFLVLSDTCSDEEFKKEIIDFIVKEAGHIFKQESWRKFQKEHPILAVDVYDACNNAPVEVILGTSS